MCISTVLKNLPFANIIRVLASLELLFTYQNTQSERETEWEQPNSRRTIRKVFENKQIKLFVSGVLFILRMAFYGRNNADFSLSFYFFFFFCIVEHWGKKCTRKLDTPNVLWYNTACDGLLDPHIFIHPSIPICNLNPFSVFVRSFSVFASCRSKARNKKYK